MSETNKTYRNAGLYSFGDGFNIKNNAPIDSRTYVNNITDIYDDDNWSKIDVKPYPGLIVSAPSGDVKIYVGPPISKISDITGSTEQIGWRDKANWLDVNIPQFDESDAGRLLTIVETTNDDQTTSYSAQWVDAPSGLPTMGQNEAGKLLTVVETSTGSGVYVAQWVNAPSGLPTINPETDANKILQVQVDEAGTAGVAWVDETKELPTYTDADGGKVLTVSSDGTSTEWSTVDTSFMKSVTTDELYSLVRGRQLKPGMKYRITDYAPALEPNYSINAIYGIYNIGVDSKIKFDIIATASSEYSLFDDVELVLKDGVGSPFEYSKYEAKYDIHGNNGNSVKKYNYISQTGKGVIYYMKDQFGNEASYDFENIYYFNGDPNSSIHVKTFWDTTSTNSTYDLRSLNLNIVQNVRMTHSDSDLPGIIFSFNRPNQSAIIHNVEINNCKWIQISDTIICNAKFSNSTNIRIDADLRGNNNGLFKYPTFENLNICDNNGLRITCPNGSVTSYENVGGLYLNNINFHPSSVEKTVMIPDLIAIIKSIFNEYLTESIDEIEAYCTPENAPWILALLDNYLGNTNASEVVMFSKEISDAGNVDFIIHDLMVRSSKFIIPQTVLGDIVRGGAYKLEIPQFQSTATSVVELGI